MIYVQQFYRNFSHSKSADQLTISSRGLVQDGTGSMSYDEIYAHWRSCSSSSDMWHVFTHSQGCTEQHQSVSQSETCERPYV